MSLRMISGWCVSIRALASSLVIVLASAAFSPATTGCSGGLGTSSDSDLSASRKSTAYYINDHLGSAQILTDGEGQVVYEGLTAPYGLDLDGLGTGATEGQGGDNGPDYSYTTKELDDETGLIYFGKRYYSPDIGRWITPDPKYITDPASIIQNTLSSNLYAYVNNNPLNYIDPDGHDPLPLGPRLVMGEGPDSEIHYVKGFEVEARYDASKLAAAWSMQDAALFAISLASIRNSVSLGGIGGHSTQRNSVKRDTLQSTKRLSGFGDLTIDETNRNRDVAIEAKHDFYVVGSAARAERGMKRAVSDIDYLVEWTDDLAYKRYNGNMTIEDLILNKAPGPHEHGIFETNYNPDRGPGILFKADGTIKKVGK